MFYAVTWYARAMMDTQPDPTDLGPYQIVRRLRTGFDAECWLALHERHTSHALYRFGPFRDKAERRRFVEALEAVSPLHHTHILPIDQYSLDDAGWGWVVTPFTGNQQGLVRLSGLVQAKGGRLGPTEGERCVTQLLEAYAYGHANGADHGPIAPDQVLVDTRGSVWIELFGLRRRLEGLARADRELVRDSMRSVVELGYWLLTGLPAEEPRIRASRLVRRLDKRWDEWFETGLEPTGGFASGDEALAALPGARKGQGVEPARPRVRSVIGRLRAGGASQQR